MNYSCKYKLKNQWFYRNIKKIRGDGIMKDSNYPTRFFILENEERIEIPIPDTIFHFSQERFMSIKKTMENEAGQEIKVK